MEVVSLRRELGGFVEKSLNQNKGITDQLQLKAQWAVCDLLSLMFDS